MVIDLVSVDYDLIRKWLNKHHVSRRKLCIEAGIPEGTIAAAFKRRSKMQVAYLWKIADYMGVKPIELILHDKDGNVNPDDLDRVLFGRTDYEIEIENETIGNIVDLLKGFNPGGLEVAGKMIGLLWEIPRLRKDINEYYDGSPDYWKQNPYKTQVRPYNEEEIPADEK